jgi:uncharacterized membrane protein
VEIFTQVGGEMLSRWGHYLAGVTWIGLLYYFNFVQTPAFAQFEAPARNEAFAKLVPRAMWWFRWGAVLTVLTGISILAFQDQLDGDYMKSAGGISISTGILLALVMFLNVWGIIWRAQKRVIANAQNVLAGNEADPSIPALARKAACASRTNTFFSIPMLFFMGATSHFFPRGDYVTSDGADRAVYWLIVVVIVAVFEAIAVSAPAVGKPQAWHIDSHRNTIIGGFVLTAVLYLLWELFF